MDAGEWICLEVIKMCKNRVIKPKLWDIMSRTRGESWNEIKGK